MHSPASLRRASGPLWCPSRVLFNFRTCFPRSASRRLEPQVDPNQALCVPSDLTPGRPHWLGGPSGPGTEPPDATLAATLTRRQAPPWSVIVRPTSCFKFSGLPLPLGGRGTVINCGQCRERRRREPEEIRAPGHRLRPSSPPPCPEREGDTGGHEPAGLGSSCGGKRTAPYTVWSRTPASRPSAPTRAPGVPMASGPCRATTAGAGHTYPGAGPRTTRPRT